MNLHTYTKELLQLNRSRLRSFTDCPHFSHVLFGLCEELLELHQKLEIFSKAKRKNKQELWQAVVLELGDVLAYTTLAASALRLDPMMRLDEIAEDVEASLSVFFVSLNDEPYVILPNKLIELALSVAGKSKRWYREASPISVKEIGNVFVEAYNHVKAVGEENLSFEQVAESNISKLKARALNNTLFVGSGDNR